MIQQHADDTDLNKEAHNLPVMVTVLCNMMTCYAMRPCIHKACEIERHINALLNSPLSDELGDWTALFEKLQCQWTALSECHARAAYRKIVAESKKSPTH